MLKTITKFVLQRRRDVRQLGEQVVEESANCDPQSYSEAPPQPAEPQLDEPSSQPVWAKVKWYNPAKRYGFVVLSDGSGDAFLHATALAGSGVSTLQPGETLALRVAPAERGLLVTEVISVDSSTAAPSRPSRTRFRSSSDTHPSEAAVQEMGTVKWYNAGRGFGVLLNIPQHRVLILCGEIGEVRPPRCLRIFVNRREAQRVRRARRGKRTGESAVDVMGRPRLSGSRLVLVSRDQAGDDRLECVSLGCSQCFQRFPRGHWSRSDWSRGNAWRERGS